MMITMLMYLLSVLVVTTLARSHHACVISESQKVSQFIINHLNTTVDPCEDMYQFACGGWIEQNDIPQGYFQWSHAHQIYKKITKQVIELLEEDGWIFKGRNSTAVRKIKQFYKSCLDVQEIDKKGAEPLKKMIDDYGSWTVTDTNTSWNEETWNLQKVLEKTHNLTGSAFWNMAIAKDVKNASRNILSFQQAGLTLQKYAHFYQEETIRIYYMKIVTAIGRLLGGNNETVYEKMSKVFTLEKRLSEIFIPREELLDHNKLYNLMTLSQFQNIIGPWIDLEKYLETHFGPGVITSNDEILVLTPDYFRKLEGVINSTEDEYGVLANYVIWNTILPGMGYLPKAFSVADVQVIQPVETSKIVSRLQLKCLEKSKRLMKFVTGALYVDRHFSHETVVKVVSALDDMEREFIKNLDQLSWLDSETKRNLKEKAEAMVNHVGYPNWILDPIRLDARYEDLVIEDGEYFRNFLHLYEYQSNFVKRTLKQPPERYRWLDNPDEPNAYYNFHENQMVVLAGILQEPYLSKDYPTSYLYGVLGAILAHELVHGFDSLGRQYDKDGNLKDNWTPHVSGEFNRRAQCFIDQYNGYSLYGQNTSGLLTLAENIADNGGVKLGYKAYKSSRQSNAIHLPGLNLTNDQLYFVGFSMFFCATSTKKYDLWSLKNDEHSPNVFRVNGAVSNSREFSEVFNCPVNSTMNPENKCELW